MMESAPGERSAYQYFALVGVGRSGTSLLMTMLDSHPRLAMPPEIQFVRHHVVGRPKAGLEEMRQRLKAESHFSRLGLDVDEFLEPFSSGRIRFSNAQAYHRLMETWVRKENVSIVGDKAPKHVEFLPVIRALYPDAKVIHIIRDPRDVYLSRTRAGWSAGRSDWVQTLAYRAQFDYGRYWGPRLFGSRYLEVRYEKILARPEAELGRICELLGVAFDAGMLDRKASAATHVFDDEMPWKKEVLGPLLRDNTNKWKKQLPAAKVAYIEDACHTAFRGKEGYSPAVPGRIGQGGLRGLFTRGHLKLVSLLYRGWLRWQNRRTLAALRREGCWAAAERTQPSP